MVNEKLDHKIDYFADRRAPDSKNKDNGIDLEIPIDVLELKNKTDSKPLDIDDASNIKQRGSSIKTEMLPVDLVVPYRGKQPFRTYVGTDEFNDLMSSIAKDGVTTAITVRPIRDDEAFAGKYEICSGYHRWMACKQLKKTEIPAYVMLAENGDMVDDNTFAMKLIESNFGARQNILKQSEKIMAVVMYSNLVEKKQGFRTDLQGADSDENNRRNDMIARLFDMRNPKDVMKYQHVYKLPEGVLDMVDARNVTYDVCYKISQCDDLPELQKEVYDYILSGGRLTAKTFKKLKEKYQHDNKLYKSSQISDFVAMERDNKPRVFRIDQSLIPDGKSNDEIMKIITQALEDYILNED